jgi:hypothetical protein
MQNLTVSLSENILKLTLTNKEDFKSISAEVSTDIVTGSEILDTQEFSIILSNLLKEISGGNNKKYHLHFLVDPSDVVLKFITVSKKNGDLDEQIINEVRTRLEGESLENLYFSYQKIAPFVYQFVGIRRERMERYLEIANLVGLELKSVVPWLLLLPKMVGSSEPCIFVLNSNGNQTVALSELNGIYFSAVYSTQQTSKELESLVSELSIYKRVTPITKIYTLRDETFSLDPGYKVIPLMPAGEEFKELYGYELHAVFDKLIEDDSTLLETQMNMLHTLPVPVVSNKSNALVYVGGVVAALVIVVGLFIFLSRGDFDLTNRLAIRQPDNTEVLSEIRESDEEPKAEEPVQEVELDREDLYIRVENASNVDGVASGTRDLLSELGYVEGQIEIGNAEETGRENTLLKFKDSKMMYAGMVFQDLEEEFDLVTEGGLDEDLDYDLLILVGGN